MRKDQQNMMKPILPLMKRGYASKPRALRPVACVALAAGAAIIGLTPTVSEAAPTVTLQFWNAYNTTDKEAVTMQNVVLKRFEQLNPGIKVVSVVVPYSDLLQKYIAAAAAGDPPAVMRSDIIWVPQLAQEGVLLNLTHLKWFQPIKEAALPGPLSTNYYRGSYYGMPDDTNTQVFFWNKGDFAAAGLTSPPKTLAQVWTDAQKLTNKAKGVFGLGIDGTDIWNVSPYIWSNGGSFTNKYYTQAAGFVNSRPTEATLQELLNLYKAGDIGSDFLGGSGAVSGETGFPKGEYAMYIDGPWAVPTYAEDNFSGYGMELMPKGPGGSVSVVGGEDLVVAKDVQHMADAVKLAQFLTSPFAQLQMAEQGDLATYKTDLAAEVRAKPYLKVFNEQLLTAEARPVNPNYVKFDTIFSTELQEAVAGKISLSNALLTTAAEGTQVLRGS
jgi:multiple sugar transport system substrate-binding protein